MLPGTNLTAQTFGGQRDWLRCNIWPLVWKKSWKSRLSLGAWIWGEKAVLRVRFPSNVLMVKVKIMLLGSYLMFMMLAKVAAPLRRLQGSSLWAIWFGLYFSVGNMIFQFLKTYDKCKCWSFEDLFLKDTLYNRILCHQPHNGSL